MGLQGFWPGVFGGGGGWGGRGLFGVVVGGDFGLFWGLVGGLVVGAEPADLALGFFGGALVVQVDEALEEFFFGFLLVFGLFGPGRGGAGAADVSNAL